MYCNIIQYCMIDYAQGAAGAGRQEGLDIAVDTLLYVSVWFIL